MCIKLTLLAYAMLAGSVAAADTRVPKPGAEKPAAGVAPTNSNAPTVPGNTPDAAAPPSQQTLPVPKSDHDAAPPVAAAGADLPRGGIVSQAGIGGDVAYGRAGVLELGGSAGLNWVQNDRRINISPSIGWFIADDLELTALINVTSQEVDGKNAWQWALIGEPSYHAPLNRSTFVFGGLGLGVAHSTADGTGFALVPKLGMNFMIGRSGILSPAVSYQYTTGQSGNGALLVNFGFTVMW